MLLLAAITAVIHEMLYLVIAIVSLVPLLAAGTRRLRHAGRSGWWQLLFLIPFGLVPVFIMLALPGSAGNPKVR